MLLGGAGTVLSGGGAVPVSVPLIAAGAVAVTAGEGLRINAWNNLFDVKIYKSDAGDGSGGKGDSETGNDLKKGNYNKVKDSYLKKMI